MDFLDVERMKGNFLLRQTTCSGKVQYVIHLKLGQGNTRDFWKALQNSRWLIRLGLWPNDRLVWGQYGIKNPQGLSEQGQARIDTVVRKVFCSELLPSRHKALWGKTLPKVCYKAVCYLASLPSTCISCKPNYNISGYKNSMLPCVLITFKEKDQK